MNQAELMKIKNRQRLGTSRNYLLIVDGEELGRIQRKKWSEWLAGGIRHLTQSGAEQHLINRKKTISEL